jgi:hypothetical protein
MLKHTLAGAVALAMMTGASSAVSIGGHGLRDCSTWTADHQSDLPFLAMGDEQWMLGYLSGAGKWGSADLDPLNGIEAQTIYAWVSNYCAVSPSAQIQDAGNAFIHVHPH